MAKRHHIIFVAGAIGVLITVFSQCVEKAGKNITATTSGIDVRGAAYAGAAACSKCHTDIHTSYLATAHQNSSSRASTTSIKGSFDPSKNTYHYRENVQVRMEQRDSGLFQVAYMNGQERGAFPFGTVIGSGRKAQTYLYWYGDNAFQLPISFSVLAGTWVNSPNYPPDKARFDRLINVGCFECHGSYIKLKGTQEEGTRMVDYFDRSQVINGIDCERCHGPAKQHVDFHEKNPAEKKAKYIVDYAALPRQARLDLCAQCHSGAHPVMKTVFYFKPGDTLSNYFRKAAQDNFNVPDLDVHGNQYQLMAASACFKKSEILDCASCHNLHTNERDNMQVFSQRCMTCHSPEKHNFCTMAPAVGKEIVNNCIDCHMPAAPSRVIGMKSENQQEASANLVRTHYISVYKEVAKQYIDSLKRKRG